MKKRIGSQTIIFPSKPCVIGFYTTSGVKEGKGNFKEYIDNILTDDNLGEDTFEKAERKMLEQTIIKAVEKSKLMIDDIDMLVGGDLLNQIVSSSFSAREFNISFLGLYGACSTMAESIAIGACLIDGQFFKNVACSTGSHFSSAERQYRFPLELGNQRPPFSQWTVTGAGCTVLSDKGSKIKVVSSTFGKVTDYGIKDVNNMGAAMAPAAMSSFIAHFEATKTTPDDYDLILTGDLGKLGSEIFIDLMENKNYKLGANYSDCGHIFFKNNQQTYQGASGSGCSAIVLNSYVFKKMLKGEFKKVLFGATGALLSTTSSQQGDSIPGICHVVEFEVGE